jgi:hypothetical protein
MKTDLRLTRQELEDWASWLHSSTGRDTGWKKPGSFYIEGPGGNKVCDLMTLNNADVQMILNVPLIIRRVCEAYGVTVNSEVATEVRQETKSANEKIVEKKREDREKYVERKKEVKEKASKNRAFIPSQH